MNNKYKIVNIHGHLHRGCNLDELVKEWRREGLVKFCLLALGKQWEYQGYFTNEDTLKAMRRYPDIVVGMGHIELSPPLALDPVEKIDKLKEEGFLGLKFISPCAYYSDERYFPFYGKAQELNMPIIFHIGGGAGNRNDKECQVTSEWMRPNTFDRIARSFPELKIIGAHLGGPFCEETFGVLGFPNVYCSPAGGSGSNLHISLLKRSLAPFPGADWDNADENAAKLYFKKFVFGTDNPPVSVWYPQAMKLMDYLHIDEETRELFFWKNAANIFGWRM